MTLAQQRRDEYERTHDIYGNNESMQREIWELRDEIAERERQTKQARYEAFRREHPHWLTPMLIDEAPIPGNKRVLFDYGALPDSSEYN